MTLDGRVRRVWLLGKGGGGASREEHCGGNRVTRLFKREVKAGTGREVLSLIM